MQTALEISSASYAKEGSEFIAFLVPLARYESTLKALKTEHKKAVHFVRASRAVNEFAQITEQSSDDGEPKGSSGVPVLNVMRGAGLVECAIIVVRYFGGKLLGVGGLVRAYTNAALSVVNLANLVEFKPKEARDFCVPFANIERAKYLAKKHDIEIAGIFWEQNFAIIHAHASAENLAAFALQIESPRLENPTIKGK